MKIKETKNIYGGYCENDCDNKVFGNDISGQLCNDCFADYQREQLIKNKEIIKKFEKQNNKIVDIIEDRGEFYTIITIQGEIYEIAK